MAELTLQRLTLTIDQTPILSEIDTRFCSGRVHLILGANGSGKSILIQTALGLFRPDTGTVRWNGVPLPDAERELRRETATVLQRGALQILGETVRHDLEIGLAAAAVPRNEWAGRIGTTASEYGISDWLHAPPETLSGGFQQRLVLAAASIGNPSIIFFDEPLLELDYPGRLFFLNRLNELSRDGTGIVIATHNYRIFWEMADNVLILSNGSSCFDGEKDQSIPFINEKSGLEPW